MKGRMLKIVLSALMAGLTTLSSMPVSAFTETTDSTTVDSSDAHVHEHETECEESHDHCDEYEEVFLGNGITVAVLDSGITAFETAKSISFVDDAEFNNHGNQMAETLLNEVPEIALYDVRVLDSEGKGKYSDISEAIIWSVNNDADIIVMSFEGYEASTILEDAVKYAAENDVLMIASAGNDSEKEIVYPAAYSTVISAGVIDECGEVCTGLNHGESVDIYVEAVGGTSFAAQYIAADAVRYMQENPDQSSKEVKAVLTNNKSKEHVSENAAVDGTVYAAACVHAFDGSYTVTKKPTCTTSGTQVGKCRKCNAVIITVTLKKLGHNWKYNKTVLPTCYSQGYDLYKCSRSGCSSTTKKNYKSALSHKIGSWTITKAATCSATGTRTRKCTRSGCTFKETEVISKLNHTAIGSSYVTTKAPTCTTTGVQSLKCNRAGCNAILGKRIVKAKGHQYTYIIKDGIVKCSVCEQQLTGNNMSWNDYVNKSGVTWESLSKNNQIKFAKGYLAANGLNSDGVELVFKLGKQGSYVDIESVSELKNTISLLQKGLDNPVTSRFSYFSYLAKTLGFLALAADATVFYQNAKPTFANAEATMTSLLNLSSALSSYIPIYGSFCSNSIDSLREPIEDVLKIFKSDISINNTYWSVAENIDNYPVEKLLQDYNLYIELANSVREFNGVSELSEATAIVDYYIYCQINEKIETATRCSLEEIYNIIK